MQVYSYDITAVIVVVSKSLPAVLDNCVYFVHYLLISIMPRIFLEGVCYLSYEGQAKFMFLFNLGYPIRNHYIGHDCLCEYIEQLIRY